MEPKIISKKYQEYYQKILYLLNGFNDYTAVTAFSVSEDEPIYMRIKDGKALYKGGDEKLEYLKEYDKKQLEYEIIAQTLLRINYDTMPKEIRVTETEIKYAQEFLEFLEQNAEDINKTKKEEDINTEKAIFATLYGRRRDFENKKAIKTKSKKEEYYLS